MKKNKTNKQILIETIPSIPINKNEEQLDKTNEEEGKEDE